MKTLKEDSKIEAQGKLDERIHFASYMPARTKWMSALGDLCQLGDQLPEEQAEELRRYLERLLEAAEEGAARMELKHEANRAVADMLREEMADTLGLVLFELSGQMKNAYSRSDA